MTSLLPPRRLAAVWFADVAGFTRLSAADEPRALRVVEAMRASARAAVTANHGSLVKFLGDGALAEFPSAEGAVEAALEVMARFRANARNIEGGPYKLHVGIHVGDVTVTADGDIFGDGVNRAARLQTIAEPGQILVSEEVCRLVRSRPELLFSTLGKRALKGLDEAILVFAVEARGALAGRMALLERPTVPRPGSEVAAESLSRGLRHPRAIGTGIAAGLIAFIGLGIWSAMGGTASGSPRETEAPDAVVPLRTAGAVPWAVPASLELPPPVRLEPLASRERPAPAEAPAPDPVAEEESAPEPGPDVPAPTRGLADLARSGDRTLASFGGRDLTWHEVLPTLRRGVDEALAGTPEGSQAAALEGLFEFMVRWDHRAAESAFQAAIAADPGSGAHRRLYAQLLMAEGRFGEAHYQLAQARGKGLPDAVVDAAEGALLFREGRFKEAQGALEDAVDAEPQVLSHRILLARTLVARGRHDQAIEVLSKAAGALAVVPWMGWASLDGAGRDERAGIRARVLEGAAQGGDGGYAGAVLLMEAGEIDRALAALDAAIRARHPAVVWLAVDPEWAPLRGDPRFDQRVARVVPRELLAH